MKDKLKGILFVACVIALIGFAGGLEQGMMTIPQYIIYSVIALAVMYSTKGVKAHENNR